MFMSIQKNTEQCANEKGSALVIALIVLAILGALGYAALDVAELNIFMSANDRDNKAAFFHADSGVNIGHIFLNRALISDNATFYETNAHTWKHSAFVASSFPLTIYLDGGSATYVKAGSLATKRRDGMSGITAAGYEGTAYSSGSGGTSTEYLIRAHRQGARNSAAEVDIGWEHVNYAKVQNIGG